MRLISFIIPAYNSASYISRCLDSIYNLNLQESDFEVIVVDDCSKDNTVDVIRCYEDKYENLVLLQQSENHRQGAARNRGISIARGEYVAFVDSDDMSADGVVSALEMSRKLDLDMAVMNFKVISERGNAKDKSVLNFDEGEIFTGVEMQTRQPYWCSGPVPYLYKLSFLKRINYPFAEDVLYEDADFVNVHLYYAKKMAYSKECGYVVCENLSSTTHALNYKNVADLFLLGVRMLNLYSMIEDKTAKYAMSILEGGSFNIYSSFKKLNKLVSQKEVKSVFDRIDERYDRRSLLVYQEPKYCWNWWTRLCLKHKYISIFIASLGMMCSKIIKNRSVISYVDNRIQSYMIEILYI